MTRTSLGALALLLGSTGLVEAGGLDRSLTPIGVIFEEGNYAELSFGFTSPSVEGSVGGVASGNVGVDYTVPILSFKYDVSDRFALGVVVDQPYGADVDYEDDTGYPSAGSNADFRSSGVTVLGRYKFNDSFSIHGGARYITTDADLFVRAELIPGLSSEYEASYDSDSDTAFIVGAAYERPAIALRVALTYTTETEFSNAVTYNNGLAGVPGPDIDGRVEYTLPQTVALDFRTGIAADTLLFGQVRWSDWSETNIVSPGYTLYGIDANPVVDYEKDVYTTTLGIGRRFSERISGAASVIYETKASAEFDPNDTTQGASNLAPYDGQLGLQIGGTYALDNGIELTAGVRYTRLGDVQTRTIGAEFEDNEAVSLGLRVGYRF